MISLYVIVDEEATATHHQVVHPAFYSIFDLALFLGRDDVRRGIEQGIPLLLFQNGVQTKNGSIHYGTPIQNMEIISVRWSRHLPV